MPNGDSVIGWITDTLAGWWRDTRIAAAFLTRVPLAGERPADVPALASAVRAFPIVGAGVGLVAAAGLLLASWAALPPLVCAFVALALAVGLTGALHEDGLADVADGFGGGEGLAEKLNIMRDSRIGVYGVLALVFGVGLRVAALAGMSGPGTAAAALIAAGAVSRGVLPVVMYRLAPARPDGLAADAGRPEKADVLTGALLGAALGLLFFNPLAGFLTLVCAAAAAAALAVLAQRQIGGYTGDVLGAVQQVTEVAVLAAVVAVG